MILCIVGAFIIAGPLGAVAGVAARRVIPALMILLLAGRRGSISLWRELLIGSAFVAGQIAVSMAVGLGITDIAQLWRL